MEDGFHKEIQDLAALDWSLRSFLLSVNKIRYHTPTKLLPSEFALVLLPAVICMPLSRFFIKYSAFTLLKIQNGAQF